MKDGEAVLLQPETYVQLIACIAESGYFRYVPFHFMDRARVHEFFRVVLELTVTFLFRLMCLHEKTGRKRD